MAKVKELKKIPSGKESGVDVVKVLIKRHSLFYLIEKKCSCGCTACFAVCPQNAITMKPDKEGFMYPGINDVMCIRCYKVH